MGKGICIRRMIADNSHKQTLVLASRNDGKIREFKQLFASLPVKLVSQPKGLDVEESGKTFAENARIKAIAVAKATGSLAIADDSGLSVKALGGAPGVFSARYASNDRERIARLLYELEGVNDRSAFFTAAICIASEAEQILMEVEGLTRGSIALSPKGEKGFGYDPVFKVSSVGITYAEMSTNQKREFGHRGKAFRLLEPSLNKLIMDPLSSV